MQNHSHYSTGDHYWTELIYSGRQRDGLDWKLCRVIVFAYHDINNGLAPNYSSWVPTYVTAPYGMAE